jgi:hypothetical protein
VEVCFDKLDCYNDQLECWWRTTCKHVGACSALDVITQGRILIMPLSPAEAKTPGFIYFYFLGFVVVVVVVFCLFTGWRFLFLFFFFFGCCCCCWWLRSI